MKNIDHLINSFPVSAEEVEKLEGYASINYRIKSKGETFVLKHYTDPTEFNLIKAEVDLLKEISASSLPFKVPSSEYDLKILADHSFTRLVGFIEGDLLSSVDHSDELLGDFGRAVALLNKSLSTKRNEVIEARKPPWDMQNSLMNRSIVDYISEHTDKKIVNYYLDLFELHIQSIQHSLRHSIIHSDLNDNNIIVKDEKIEGIIDFGDITYAPLIYEVAIALAYIMIANKENPFAKAAEFLKSYHEIIPLRKDEISLLYYLIPSRLCVSVCYSALAKTKGEDTDYILISEKPAWDLLYKWIRISPIWATNYFLEALGFSIQKLSADPILEKRTKYIAASLRLSYNDPIYMTGGAFQYMYDNFGNTYLDAYNNIPHIGHCHPNIARILSEKARTLNTNTRYLYPELGEYAQQLCSKLPKKLTKVYFLNSGSEATDLAIRIARKYRNRKSIAILENGYHGHTATGIEISDYKFNGKGGQGKSDDIICLPLANLYNGKFSNTNDYVENAIELLNQAIDKNLTPATLIVEPISGCGGQIPLAANYLKKLKPFLVDNKILLTVDEVQTGFGRLGDYFWGFEMHNIIPDIVILGKPMGNGHPIAAVITTEEIADSFSNGMEFFSSFGGNPISCAVAREVLNIIKEEKLQENALIVGKYLKQKLLLLKNNFSCIGDVRGTGLFLGIEFIDINNKPNEEFAVFIKEQMKAKFVLLGTDGPNNNVIKIKPPLCFNKANADELIKKFEDVLRENKK